MNKIKYLLGIVILLFSSSCIKNDEITVQSTVIEWDAATYNANSAGLLYPLLTRYTGYGRATVTTDPLLTRTSGTVKLRVNLVGPQRSTATEISYSVQAAGTTAVSGTHFTTTGKATIPANSSFAEVEVVILNPGASTGGAKTLALELLPSGDIKPSENEKYIGLSIAQN
ncbi:DUF4843 domain-containing protein [Hufsiella ginkgonis]|uniref:DUF4843 domain-containing protein n=1 Tax=Hufsiella ginkgonis TaxID=2695274 RepID=A0A7K1XWP6_9SPHI|nr:DUF4843 domain-containing protein [Hufsiella ginkgonis]MXV15390.1 DUF4843 domain-containing protein [Hufsiella ginkgonis]